MNDSSKRPTPPIARPKRPGDWEVIARSEKVGDAWSELSNQQSGECQRVYDQLSTKPDYNDGDRQLPLKGEVGWGTYEGKRQQRWQIDVASGSRIWYFIIEEETGKGQKRRSGKVVVEQVFPGHPKSTEKNNSGKRHPGRN